MFQFPAFASYTLCYSGEDTLSQCLETSNRPIAGDWLRSTRNLMQQIFQAFKVGFPIRRSMDQSLFAAPHGFSQRITSFIACACQGIHQMPLRHLIVLIANAHHLVARSRRNGNRPGYLLQPSQSNNAIDVFDRICFIGRLRRCSSLAGPIFKTSFSRLDPIPRGQATVNHRSSVRCIPKDATKQQHDPERQASFLPPVPPPYPAG